MPDYKSFNGAARCPFYIGVSLIKEQKNIICEGCFDETHSLKFSTLTHMRSMFNTYCAKQYKDCPYYRAIDLFKYSDLKEHKKC